MTEDYHLTEAARMACQDCTSEVRLTQGTRLARCRVIHSATCPWLRRYLAKQVGCRIPCGATVTHRGPYKRDPERAVTP